MSHLRLGLLGRGISHSRSPALYRQLLPEPHTYELLDCAAASDVPSVDQLAQRFDGLNITAPWKELFFPYAVAAAQRWGAVNCLRFQAGTVTATNTDALALQELIPAMRATYQAQHFVVLGDGVMSRVFMRILGELGLSGEVRSRRKGDNIAQASFPASPGDARTIVVNACAREFEFQGDLGAGCVLWDLNYAHPAHTKRAAAEGWTYVDGSELLETQAKYAVKFWREKSN